MGLGVLSVCFLSARLGARGAACGVQSPAFGVYSPCLVASCGARKPLNVFSRGSYCKGCPHMLCLLLMVASLSG